MAHNRKGKSRGLKNTLYKSQGRKDKNKALKATRHTKRVAKDVARLPKREAAEDARRTLRAPIKPAHVRNSEPCPGQPCSC